MWYIIYGVNPLYLRIDHANGYIEEKNGKKYLFFDSVDENKELLKNYNHFWNGIRDKIKEISSGQCNYEKDSMKIKFNSDNNLSLNKPLKFRLMTVIIRCGFSEGGKFYPQLFFMIFYKFFSVWIKRIIFFYNFFLLYIKFSDIADLTCYQKNRNVILNKKKIFIKIIKRD